MSRNTEQILEELLVLQAQRGDAQSIAQLVNNWHSRFVRYAFNIIAERETASDVVQDSWIAILKGIRKIDDPANFRSWAYRIVHNKSYDSIRKNIKRRSVREGFSHVAITRHESNPQDPASTLESTDDDIQLLRDAIGQLNTADQTILTLYYEEGLSIREIQQVTGASAGKLKARLHYLRKKLKSILERNKNGQQQH